MTATDTERPAAGTGSPVLSLRGIESEAGKVWICGSKAGKALELLLERFACCFNLLFW